MSQKPDPTVSEESFLQRWSRRKRAHQMESAAEPKPPAMPETPAAMESEPRPTLTDADMPPLDSLSETTDMRGFFSEGVSPQLRQQALRALFKQSRFNACDGLDVYAEDYTRFEPLGDIITHEMRRALAAEQEKAETAETAAAEAATSEEVTEVAAQSREPAATTAPVTTHRTTDLT